MIAFLLSYGWLIGLTFFTTMLFTYVGIGNEGTRTVAVGVMVPLIIMTFLYILVMSVLYHTVTMNLWGIL